MFETDNKKYIKLFNEYVNILLTILQCYRYDLIVHPKFLQASYFNKNWKTDLNNGFSLLNNKIIVLNSGIYNISFQVTYLLPSNTCSCNEYYYQLYLDSKLIISISPTVINYNTMTLEGNYIINNDTKQLSIICYIDKLQVLSINTNDLTSSYKLSIFNINYLKC